MKKYVLLMALWMMAMWTPVAISEIWKTSTFEASPTDNDSVAAGAGKIRDTRAQTARRGMVGHYWSDEDSTSDDNGLHRQGSARVFSGTTEPTTLSDGHSVAAGIADYDNTSATAFGGEGTLANSATNSAAADEDDVGHGRLWVDTDGPTGVDADDDKMYWYEGGTGFVEVKAQHDNPIEFQDGILFGENLIDRNGGFDWGAINGTTGGGEETDTGLPKFWSSDSGTPTFAYAAVGGTDDDAWGPGLYLTITNAGAADDSIKYEVSNLREGHTYKVVARAKDDGTAVCQLDVLNNGGTPFVPDSTTTDLWETLTGTFGTSGTALDDVEIQLQTDGVDTTACSWDHIRLYDQGDVSATRYEPPIRRLTPTRIVRRNESASTANCSDNAYGGADADCQDLLIVQFTPPSPGWRVDEFSIQTGYDGGPGAGVCNNRVQKNGVDFIPDVELCTTSPGTTYASTHTLAEVWQDDGVALDGCSNIAAINDNILTKTQFRALWNTELTEGTQYTFDVDTRDQGTNCIFDVTNGNHFLEIVFSRREY